MKQICDSCIHFPVCSRLGGVGIENCHDYTEHNMPFTIGQPMWKLCTWYRSPAEILESRVSMIQQKADKSWKVRISNRYGTEDFKAGDIGTYIFLTKEAAEEALAKLTERLE